MEKRNYWLKLPEGFFESEEMTSLREMDDGERLTLYYIKLLHESITTNGMLDNPTETLSVISDSTTAEKAMATFQELKLIALTASGWKLTKADIGSETLAAERMRKSREKRTKCNIVTNAESECNIVTTPEGERNIVTKGECNIVTNPEKMRNIVTKACNIVTASEPLVDIRSTKNSMYNLVMERNEIEMNSSDYYYDQKENKSRDNTARGCAYVQALLDKKSSLEKYIDVCNVITEEVSLDQDRPTQERLGTFMLELGKEIDSKKTITIKGNEVDATEVLDTFRSALETGISDELFIRTIREVEEKVLDGKVQGNQKAYLISTLYERIKAGGAI